MGNMNVSKGQPAIQKPATSAPKPAQGSSASQATSGTASHEQDPFLGPKLCDQTQAPGYKDKLEKLPPVAPPGPKFGFGNDSGKTVERILDIGMAHSKARENGYMIKTPDVEFHLAYEMDDMTPGEMDDLRDAIVDRMASPDTSQREREVLKRMYNFVDNATDEASGLKPDVKKILDDIRPYILCTTPEPPGFEHPGKPIKLPPGIKPGGPHLQEHGIHQKLDSINHKPDGINHKPNGPQGFPGKPQIKELDISAEQQEMLMKQLKELK